MPFLLLGLLLGIELLNRATKERAVRDDAAHQRQIVTRLRIEEALMAARESDRLQQSLAALDSAADTCTDLRWRAEIDRLRGMLPTDKNTW